jgi:Protein of unknown function (DUF3433)
MSKSQDQRIQSPTFLRPIVGWAVVALCLILAVIIVVLLVVSQRQSGLFGVSLSSTNDPRNGVLHLLWSSGPTLVMTTIVTTLLTPLALALYLVAPYTELEKGGKAEHTIMVNYAVVSMAKRLLLALKNRKLRLVTLTIACFLGSLLGAAASGLITPQTISVGMPRGNLHRVAPTSSHRLPGAAHHATPNSRSVRDSSFIGRYRRW